jgi:[DsrC]-trisulfide reductase subunit M
MKAIISFIIVLFLVLIAYAGGSHAPYIFGVVIPYLAVLLFIGGMIYRVLLWGSSPVPFRIPTTCGQQKSLPWIKHSKLESPSGLLGVIGRMALEVLLFRSLFRNVKTQLQDGPRLTYGEAKWLWMAGLAFHWTFLVILIRHLRFFLVPVPGVIVLVEELDSFLQVGVPLLYITDVVFLGAVLYLFLRRIGIPQMRYISLVNDYFPLFLVFGIGLTGVLMRYFLKTDIESVKELTMGLVTFAPSVPAGIGVIFYIHLFLLCSLIAYFPFSKLAHMGGVFLSPTRNLANNNRAKRHINPWNYPVHVHTYEEYEHDFRDKMKNAGLPVEKE